MITSIIGIIINSFILLYAANYMGIYYADFGRCFLVSLSSGVISFIPPFNAENIGWLLSAVITIVLIKFIMATSWGRAVLTYIVLIVATLLLACGLTALLVTGSCLCVPLGG